MDTFTAITLAQPAPLTPVDTPHDGRPHTQPAGVLCAAELAECTCPEFCERDHDTD